MRRLGMLLLIFVTGACAAQNEVELSLVATNVVLRTEIAQLRETATVAADRLMITAEYVGTLVVQSQDQNGQLRATLVSRGADPAALSELGAGNVTPLPTFTEFAPNPQATPAANPETTQATPETTAPALTGVVMARSVSNNDCAQDITTAFTANDERIYVVATALNITPGTTISARYSISGQEIIHSFTPDFSINNNCIWFFMDKTDTDFIPGNWSVTLDINGAPATQPVTFSIAQ